LPCKAYLYDDTQEAYIDVTIYNALCHDIDAIVIIIFN